MQTICYQGFSTMDGGRGSRPLSYLHSCIGQTRGRSTLRENLGQVTLVWVKPTKSDSLLGNKCLMKKTGHCSWISSDRKLLLPIWATRGLLRAQGSRTPRRSPNITYWWTSPTTFNKSRETSQTQVTEQAVQGKSETPALTPAGKFHLWTSQLQIRSALLSS